jgi:hypothetical protein
VDTVVQAFNLLAMDSRATNSELIKSFDKICLVGVVSLEEYFPPMEMEPMEHVATLMQGKCSFHEIDRMFRMHTHFHLTV